MGYAFFLRALEPLHSFIAVVAVQHLLGVCLGVAVYGLLRGRYAVPGWVAAVVAAPLLLDAYQLHLEQLLMSDALFGFLVLGAVLLLLWKRTSVVAVASAGLLLGLSATTRSIGLPLVLLVAVWLLLRRVGWAVVTALVVACLTPVAAYAVWFHATWGRYDLTNTDGVFLYARTTTFVHCQDIHPTPAESTLCPREPVHTRPPPPDYVWRTGPIGAMPQRDRFSPQTDALARRFADRAIIHEPLAYLRTSVRDLVRTFGWNRTDYPDLSSTGRYRFQDSAHLAYPGRVSAIPYTALPGNVEPVIAYGHNAGKTPVVEPLAGFLRTYQRVVYVRGTMLALVLAAGFVLIIRRWRRFGGDAALPWLVSVGLIAVPPFVVAFDYRYVLPALPLACLTVGVAMGERLRPSSNAGKPLPVVVATRQAVAAAADDVPAATAKPSGDG